MRALSSEEQMYEVLKASLDSGINHLETSPLYGDAESFLGKSIKRLANRNLYPSHGWVITSKLLPGISFKEGKEQLKELLSRLLVSKIDNLAVHGLNLYEHLEWATSGEGSYIFKWAKDSGLVQQIGFSSHGSYALINDAINTGLFTFCSLHLHLLDQERIPLAKKAITQGMGVMAISPSDKGGKLQTPSSTLIKDCKPFSPIELAYRFLLANRINTLTLGAEKKEDLLIAKKLAASNHPLSEIEKNTIAKLELSRTNRLGETMCAQCKKCIPCPNFVPIPNILHLRNLLIGHDLVNFTKERYNLIGKAGHWWESINASNCERCGECLPKCPYHLQIPDLLEETHKTLIDNPRKRLWD